MHTSGKVFLWLSVLLALAGLTLLAKTHQVRDSYMKKVVAQNKILAQNEIDLADVKLKLREANNTYANLMLGWDRTWYNRQVTIVSAQDGKIEAEVGLDHGIRPVEDAGNLEKLQVVYCFQPDGDGFSYVGDFRVTAALNNRCGLQANWRVRPSEVANWKPGAWRIRSVVPAQYVVRFHTLEMQITQTDELLDSKIRDLADQEKLLVLTGEQLTRRLAELNGFPGVDGQNRDREYVAGLLTALKEAEEQRNSLLIEVSSLEHELKRTRDNFNRLINENLRLANSLPQEPAAATVTKLDRE